MGPSFFMSHAQANCQSMSAAKTRFAQMMSQEMSLQERLRKIIYNQIMSTVDSMPQISIFFTEMANLNPAFQEAINLRKRNEA
jgi:hypothetical protein